MNHTILGAGGSIGNPLTNLLIEKKENVRLVSRSKYSVPGAEAYRADITSMEETIESVKGSDLVYLLAGLKYEYAVWKDLWPRIMTNVIEACKRTNAKLIFFDNVYMYGLVNGKMTEDTTYNPCSKKGEIRAAIAKQLEYEWNSGNLNAIIARAADLYGPYADKSSMPYILALDKMLKGKSAQWAVDDSIPHSFTYTIDCANALYILSKDEKAINQVWHLPTYNPALTGKEFIELAAKNLGIDPKYTVLKKWMIKLAALFDKTVKELVEMNYQNEFPYHFDSTKFNKKYNYSPVKYEDGIRETIKFFKNRKQ